MSKWRRQLKRRHRRFLAVECPYCGPQRFTNEDGCCLTCGADALCWYPGKGNDWYTEKESAKNHG